MNIFEVNTTAFDEENFFVVTTLSEEQIVSVIKPIKKVTDNYSNDDLIVALKEQYPNDTVEHYNGFDKITV